MLLELDVEEDDDACDVVNDSLFLSLPSQVALLDDGFSGLFRVFRVVEGLHDLGDLVV